MTEPVVIEIEAVDAATAAFEEVQSAGEDAAHAIEEGHRSAQDATEAYQSSVIRSQHAHEIAEESSAETSSEIESDWENLIQGPDEYQQEIEDVADAKQQLADESNFITDMISDNWMEITAVTGGAATAAEGMTRQLQDGEETIRQVAAATELTEDSIRGMAREMADATFSFEEATQLMQIARQRGLETEEQLRDFATQWDAVGDAAGENAIRLAENATVLEALGQEAHEVEESYDAFGYIIQETTMEIGEFLRSAERVSPQMREMGLELEEGAALLGLLEDQGLSGRYAMRELRRAIRDADGDMDEMLDTMEISREEFEEYISQVQGSGEVVEEYADIHAETRTPMQEFRARLEAIAGEAYGVFEVLSDLAIPLAIIGPKLKALASATKAVTAAKTAAITVGKGLLGVIAGMSTPFLAAAAAIGAITTALIVFRDEIREAFSVVGDTLFEMVDTARELPGKMFEIGRNIVSSIAEGIRDMFSAPINAIRDLGGSIMDSLRDRIGLSSPAEEFINIGAGMGEGITYGLENMEDELKEAGKMAGATPTQAADQTIATDFDIPEANGRSGQILVDLDLSYHEKIDYDEIRDEIKREVKREQRRVQS